MRFRVYAFLLAVILSSSLSSYGQRYNPGYNQEPAATPIPMAPKAAPADLPPTTSTVLRTNSMSALDNKKKLGPNDYVSFRVVEDRDNESQRLRVNDNGELEVPYIGPVPAARENLQRTGPARSRPLWREEYYYHATVILALDRVSEKSRGRIYVYGSVRAQGPQEIPPDESLYREQGDYSRRGLWRFCQQTQSEA